MKLYTYEGRSENIRTFHAPLFARAAIYTHYILVKNTFIRQLRGQFNAYLLMKQNNTPGLKFVAMELPYLLYVLGHSMFCNTLQNL